jgi:hypothetical protein
VKHRFSLGTFTRKFRLPMIFWMGSYSYPVVHNAFGLAIYLSETIYCHSGPLIFIAENVIVLAFANDLKLYMRVSSTDDCRLFQQNLDRIQGWCREKKNNLNAGKCKSILISRGSKPVMCQYNMFC